MKLKANAVSVTYVHAEVVAGLIFETKAFSVVPTGLELTILLPTGITNVCHHHLTTD